MERNILCENLERKFENFLNPRGGTDNGKTSSGSFNFRDWRDSYAFHFKLKN